VGNTAVSWQLNEKSTTSRSFWRVRSKLPLEMLKMKIDPAMYMKTKATMTKYHAQNKVFARKSTNRTIFDNNKSGLLAENAQAMR